MAKRTSGKVQFEGPINDTVEQDLFALLRAVSDESAGTQRALGRLMARSPEGAAVLSQAYELRPELKRSDAGVPPLMEIWLTLDAAAKLATLTGHPTYARGVDTEPFAWQLLLGYPPGDDGLYDLLLDVAKQQTRLMEDAFALERHEQVVAALEREWAMERYAERRGRLESAADRDRQAASDGCADGARASSVASDP